MNPLPLYWLKGHNFGDILNPILYRFITGREPVWSDQSPKILAIGSVMRMAKPGDIVWGAGCISEDTPLFCDDKTEFRLLRGPLTAKVLREKGIHVLADIEYGSPVNLLPGFIKPSQNKIYDIGFLPHYIDYGQVKELPPGVKLLNVATEPIELIHQITSCQAIISSSLHGICVAEAYGIPAVWVELSDNVVGGGFKFRDYYAGTGRNVTPLDWRNEYNWREARNRIHYAGVYYGFLNQAYQSMLESCPFRENL